MTANSVIRATTPTHYFTIESDPSLFKRILITYMQNGEIVLEKSNDEISVTEGATFRQGGQRGRRDSK